MRVFVGDVQGRADALRRLLDRVRFDPAADELWSTGDLVNRGPENAGVLRLVRSLPGGAVLGNHDVHLLRVAAGAAGRPEDTFADVLEAEDRDELLAWLGACPLLRLWPDVVLVHAALRPGWRDLERVAADLARRLRRRLARGEDPFADDDLRFVLTARYCLPDGRQADRDWPPPAPPARPWTAFWKGPRVAVFGHWARAGLQIGARFRGLDSGCVWGGRLSAWLAEEDRVVSVPCAGD